MNKYILPIFAVLVFLFFIFAIYQYSKDTSFFKSNSNAENKINDKNNPDKDAINDGTDKQDNPEVINAENNGKGAGAGTGSSGDLNPVLPEQKANESACVLARPGNLPNINCFVNYIMKNSISLKIENKLGEDIGINLDLKTCSPKINDGIENNEEKDFVFYCDNNDYFNEDIVITYILKGNGTVAIGGFVNGPVS
jgi:hypothetical protein